MTVQDVTNDVKAIAADAEPVGATFKFVFTDTEGVVHVDATGDSSIVTNDDKEADCEMHMKLETYEKLKSGKLSPTMALMMGKVKVKGDMGVALKLQSYI